VEARVISNRNRLPLEIFKLSDLLLIVASYVFATFVEVKLHNHSSLASFLSMRAKISDFLIFIFMLCLYHVTFRSFGLYHSRRLSSRLSELLDLTKALALSFVFTIALGYLFSIRMFTPTFLMILVVFTTISLLSFRIVLRIVLAQIRSRGRNLRYMLIFGTNSRAIAFASEIVRNPERGYRILGFVDDLWDGIADFRRSGFEIVSDFNGLAVFLRDNVVDEAVIYLPFGSFYSHWSEVAKLCAHHGIMVRLNADTFGLQNARWLGETVDGGHYIATQTSIPEGWPRVIKRSLDVILSLFFIIPFLPLLVAVAILVKATSRGPALFLQERVGLNRRRFKIFKFRTMVHDAEQMIHSLEERNEVAGPAFKISNDPRVTRVGRLLRRTSVDELPQLFNVLKGDMSLVGPRPLPVRDYEGFSEDWQRRRFSVKPGITCLWQVTGRSQVSFDQWMLLDLKYMDEWSLWLDLKILAKTVPAVIRGTGAV
jgi:exopolysaccharide biosynthesis polyprenyl glycosylphosphotransferase